MKLLFRILKICILFTAIAFVHIAYSQDTLAVKKDTSTGLVHKSAANSELDLLDIIHSALHKHAPPRTDTTGIKTGKLHASALPSVQYTLQTGFAVAITGNGAFYTDNAPDANISGVLMSVNYTEKKQFFVPLQANIWTKGNKFNILTDWHFEKFPQTTYGLGGYTTVNDGYTIGFTYIRLYQTLMKTIARDFYLGVGYDLDYYKNIREVDPPKGVITDFEKYGLFPNAVSSGITLNALYDSRRNAINPEPGYYANLSYRSNFSFLGSDNNWQSLLIDMRQYSHFPQGSKNILAFWNYDWFTVSGKPPYLNLASTASDTYANMGRGYIQGRFRGMNMLYLESEYRFGITSNGFLGGVVFVNAQSFTEQDPKRFEVISPGYGAGIRIKLNKFSKTNIALDYGFGAHGSQGIFANLGEVF